MASLKKKIIIFSFITFIFLLLLSINVTFFLSPIIIPFKDVLPTPSVNSSGTLYCSHIYVNVKSNERIALKANVSESSLSDGGAWKPLDCVSKFRVNLIVPYRNRSRHLSDFVHYFHRYLPLQEIDYRIFVVEQTATRSFNRGKLFNIGFVEAQKRFPAECYIFHDVDLIPLSLNNIYACTYLPRHMSSAVDVFDYELPYRTIFGGAVSFLRNQFEAVNGYSNLFYGWGGEDDDLYYRVKRAGLDVVRFDKDVALYKMLSHSKETPNPNRFTTMKKSQQSYAVDGLNNVDYKLIGYELKPLFTHIVVEL